MSENQRALVALVLILIGLAYCATEVALFAFLMFVIPAIAVLAWPRKRKDDNDDS